MFRTPFSSFLFVFGFILFICGLIQLINQFGPESLAFASTPPSSEHPYSMEQKIPVPSAIAFPSIDVDLPVIPASIQNNSWETTEKGVSYLMTSGKIGEKGNAIFYGHNRTRILGKLHDIQKGEKIQVTASDGLKYTYVITEIKTVAPEDVSVLAPTLSKRITVYTCTGFLDSKRLVVIGEIE